MTARRDLKRRVRDRQGRTGESYMTALRHVLAQRDEPEPARTPVPVVELIDISEVAAAVGMRCGARLVPALADRIDAGVALRRLVDALVATAADPDFELMRAVVLHGEERDPIEGPSLARVTAEIRRFFTRVRAGIGGISGHGQVLALAVDGRRGAEMVLFALWQHPIAYRRSKPFICVTEIGGLGQIGSYYDIIWR